jgi:AcrR family transcriptional regulator
MTRRAGIDNNDVIAAAVALVDAGGLEALSLTTLANRLGVRTPSLYNHVAGLPGLRRQLAVLGTRQLGAALSRAAIGRSKDDAVRAMAHAYRDYVLAHPGLYTATVRAAQPDEVELQEAEREVVEVVLRVLSAYGLRDDDALHAVRALRSLTHGFASIEAAGGFGLALDLDESFSRLIRGYIDGLHRAATR